MNFLKPELSNITTSDVLKRKKLNHNAFYKTEKKTWNFGNAITKIKNLP